MSIEKAIDGLEHCKYQQCIHQRKAYKKARWIKAWKRYHEREGYKRARWIKAWRRYHEREGYIFGKKKDTY